MQPMWTASRVSRLAHLGLASIALAGLATFVAASGLGDAAAGRLGHAPLTRLDAPRRLLGLAAMLAVPVGAWLAIRRRRRTLGKQRSQQTNRHLETALDNMASGLCLFDASCELTLVNERFSEIFGLLPGSARPGMSYRDLLRLMWNAGRLDGRSFDDVSEGRLADAFRHEPVAWTDRLRDGRLIQTHQQPVPDGGWIATYEDVTERHQTRERVAFLSSHDTTTGLPNSRRLLKTADELLAKGRRLAILAIDLDHFTRVNETLGHGMGDAVLGAVGKRLLNSVRDQDAVARIGGDKFAVALVSPDSPAMIATAANRIIGSLSDPYSLDGRQVIIGASVGIAVAGSTADADSLLVQADLALHFAKSDERGTARFFEEGMQQRMRLRQELQSDLRKALEADEFVLFYQPLVDARSGEVTGFEALIRWSHPNRGLVLPGEFIPLAEEMGLITAIGAWVLRRACADAAHWPSDLTIAVNVSPVQFRQPDLVRTVGAALAAAGLPASRLELEVTESVLLQETATTIAVLHELRALGIRIAMDDFGTGYSSLSYLSIFPFDKVKIDRSFTANLGRREADAIVRAVTGLAGNLGIRSLAEGVESWQQVEQLQNLGCDELQGYLFGRPSPISDVGQLVGAAGSVAPVGSPAPRPDRVVAE